MITEQEFCSSFRFQPARTLQVGIERECFLRSQTSNEFVPGTPELIASLQGKLMSDHYGPELSAYQVEYRTNPGVLTAVMLQAHALQLHLQETLGSFGLYGDFLELAPESLLERVYPTQRYQVIAASLPPAVLAAACRVAGTHVHIGMPDLETAIRVYNQVIPYAARLEALGDGSQGERMRLYREVAPQATPVAIRDALHFYQLAVQQGFVQNLRNWWSLIRITVHGTIEFRMFGNTEDLDVVASWAACCQGLCADALT